MFAGWVCVLRVEIDGPSLCLTKATNEKCWQSLSITIQIVTIMILKFVDRGSELETLNSLFNKKSAALVLLYGRRRVGKTRLVQEFLRDKRSLYFYVPNAEEKTILVSFLVLWRASFLKVSDSRTLVRLWSIS